MPNDQQPLLASAYWDYARKAVVSQSVTAPFLLSEQEQQAAADMLACYQAVPWLFRAVQMRCDAVSKMPFRITKKGSASKEAYDDSANYQNKLGFLPNPTRLFWLIEAASSFWGSAYLWRSYNARRVLGLRYLLPPTITPEIDEDQGLTGFTRYLNGQPKTVTTADIVYLWRPDPFVEIGPPLSSPVSAALSAANVLLNVDLFAAAFFQRGAIKATLLTVEGNPPKAEREALKTWWERVIGGIRNAFSTEVVSANVTPVQIGEGINDLANTTLTDEKRSEIAVALGVPQSVIHSGSATGLGGGGVARQDDKHFYDKTVVPECGWLQAELNEQVFDPQGYHLEFTPEVLEIYQAEEAALARSFQLYVDIGLPKSLAAQMVGIELPPGWEYADLDKMEAPEGKDAAGKDAADDEKRKEEQAEREAERAALEGAGKPANDDAKALPDDDEAKAGPGSAPTPFETDMRAWRLKSKRKGKVAPFVSDAIPAEIAQAVKVLGEDDWRRGFAWLAQLGAAKANREPDRAAEDALRVDITALLLDWRRRFAEAIISGDRVEYDELSDELQRLIGPYLVWVVMEGYLVQSTQMGVFYDIALVNIAALQWANTYSYELITRLDATTQKLVSEAIAQFIATPGMTIGDIERMLEQSFGEVRAEMIAITETTRAYSQSTRVLQDLLRQSGIDMIRAWKTANDGLDMDGNEKVCDICRPLEGKTEDEWPDDLKDGPPAHVKCRCGATLRLRKPAKSAVDWTWPFSMTQWATADDLAALGDMIKGGPGSGNWGHAGRPGVRGGSKPGGGLTYIGVGRGSSAEERQNAAYGVRENRGLGQAGDVDTAGLSGAEMRGRLEGLTARHMAMEKEAIALSKERDLLIKNSQFTEKIHQSGIEIETNAYEDQLTKVLKLPAGSMERATEQAILDNRREQLEKAHDRYHAAMSPTWEKVTEYNNKINAIRDQRRDEERSVLETGKPGNVEYSTRIKDQKDRSTADIAFDRFNKTVAPGVLEGNVQVVRDTTGRSFASGDGKAIHMSKGAGPATYVHELGHIIENRNPAILKAAVDFRNGRTLGESHQKLRDVTKVSAYRDQEVTTPDKFMDPYTGKRYASNGRDFATEITSMGLEHMYRDPFNFARRDPGHFDFTWDVMRGRYGRNG